MSISILEACKKRKRRPKLYAFNKFAESITPTGAFRDNIRVFLQQFCDLEDYNVEGMPVWGSLLLHESRIVVPIFTIEENVNYSPEPYCDHCRCTGWSNHFVSERKYHLIIPSDDDWNKPLEVGDFDAQTHLLHGLIHCNGFGHLLCINGIEGGSKYLCGREIMDLWDRICTSLRVRKITVEDVSKKKSMDLRLLHGVAYGHPWFGRWGYKYCHGSFGVTEHNYNRALEFLSSLELDKIIQDFSGVDQCRLIKDIFHCYRDMSETQLVTLKDLLRFMLTVKSCTSAHKKSIMASSVTSLPSSKPSTRTALHKKSLLKGQSVKYRKLSTLIANMDSRWSGRRLESAAEAIVEALKEKKEQNHGCGGMSRQEVRDAARMHIGDTGLLDYVLKSMNNVIVGSQVVRRAVNPTTRLLEYTIHDFADGAAVIEPEPEPDILEESLPQLNLEPGADVYGEVVYLYMNVLLNYPESEFVSLATQAVLDCKHFVKEWPFKDEEDQLLRYICQVIPSFVDLKTMLPGKLPPGELIMLPLHATILELKRAAESALRDTYCIMKELVVTDIENMEGMEDGELLFGAVESGAEVWFRGDGIDSDPKLRFEGGEDNWKVRCECGARDDDGERMVACDICEVWQHTRCHGIQDSETVPALFVCSGCCASLAPPRTESRFEFVSYGDLMSATSTEYGAEFSFEDMTSQHYLLC